MSTFIGRGAGEPLERLAVSPREACRLLAIGTTRLYQLIAAGELAAYKEGRARRVTTASIRARVARLSGAADAAATQATLPRRRGRPRKTPLSPEARA